MTARVLPFPDRAPDPHAAVFGHSVPIGKWTCDRDGNWSLQPFDRFTDHRGAMADRRITEQQK